MTYFSFFGYRRFASRRVGVKCQKNKRKVYDASINIFIIYKFTDENPHPKKTRFSFLQFLSFLLFFIIF